MPHHSPRESRQIGTTTIHVQDDEFFNGYQAGILLYHVQATPAGFTDMEMYAFICQQCQSVQTTDRYRAGCISGWFAALYGYQHRQDTHSVSSLNHLAQERSRQA